MLLALSCLHRKKQGEKFHSAKLFPPLALQTGRQQLKVLLANNRGKNVRNDLNAPKISDEQTWTLSFGQTI